MSQAAGERDHSPSRSASPLVDRRRQQRHLTILRVGTLIQRGRRELCLIRNISAGGLMARIYSSYSKGDALSVELKSGERVAGRVTWVADANIGITFDRPIDVEHVLASQGILESGWRPRLPRIEVDRLGTLRIGAHVYGVSTRDISQGGVKVETDERLEQGAEIVLTLDHFRPISGVVRWSKGGVCGISFNEVLPFEDLVGWLRR